MNVTLTPDTFRQSFPEFNDASVYSDAMISRVIGIADMILPALRWGNLLDVGAGFYVAHFLVQTRAAMASAEQNDGVVEAGDAGVVASASIDKVSYSLDTKSLTMEGAGQYNATAYGRQFWQLAMAFSIGGFQL